MLAKVYHSTTLQGSRTDISDSITDISNLTWKRGLDYAYVIPHPSFKVKPDLSVTKGDFIHVEFDGEIRLCTYIDKIIEPPDGQSKTLECWDILKKLEDYYIQDLSENGSWWTSDTWWLSLSTAAQEELYLWNPAGGDQSIYRYIGALFLIQVIMLHVFDIDMRAAQTSEVNTLDSIYTNYDGISSFPAIKNERLIFQFRQLQAVGQAAYADAAYESGTLLDVFKLILQTIQLQFHYETVSGDVDYKLTAYGSPSIPSSDDDGYAFKDLQVYDGTKVTLNHLSDLYDYSSSWPAFDEVSAFKPSTPGAGEKFKTFALPDNYYLHCKETGTSELVKFTTADGYFPYALAAFLADIWTTEWEEKTFYNEIEEERDLLEISYDFSKNLAKMVYIEEVT